MYRSLIGKLLLIMAPLLALSCRSLNFYSDAGKPIFSSPAHDIAPAEATDSLNVVTFNIKKARKIQLAISEMKALEKKTPVDIYLLQEMSEEGVEAIASGLGLNYLYIPIAYDPSEKKDIGNAILTRGTIDHPEKLILPHAKWQNQQRRAVTVGEVAIHQKKILVLSVHTETIAMSARMRADQVDSVIRFGRQGSSHYNYVLIGGDFNTAFPKYAHSVVNKFTSSGFDWQTSKVGSTATAMGGLVTPVSDYLFTKGFMCVNAYAIRDIRSSDHYPVFATFRY